MSSPTRAAALVGAAALGLSLLAALPAAAEPGPYGCRGFEPAYRPVQQMADDVGVVQLAAHSVGPGGSARGRVQLGVVDEFAAGVRSPKIDEQGAEAVLRKAGRRLGVELAPDGATTSRSRSMRIDLENTSRRNATFALYRGTTVHRGDVLRSSCSSEGGESVVLWKRKGRWISFEPLAQGVVRCGEVATSELAAAAQSAVCDG